PGGPCKVIRGRARGRSQPWTPSWSGVPVTRRYDARVLTPIRRAWLVRAWRAGLPGPLRVLLAPAALAYRGGLLARRMAYACGLRRTRKLPRTVVAVGNLTVGGTGKTPLVELIARRLVDRG